MTANWGLLAHGLYVTSFMVTPAFILNRLVLISYIFRGRFIKSLSSSKSSHVKASWESPATPNGTDTSAHDKPSAGQNATRWYGQSRGLYWGCDQRRGKLDDNFQANPVPFAEDIAGNADADFIGIHLVGCQEGRRRQAFPGRAPVQCCHRGSWHSRSAPHRPVWLSSRYRPHR